MSCNCTDCLEHVDCGCPETLSGVAAALNVSYIETIYSPHTIFGGYNIPLYTNTSAVNQTILIEVNAYLIAANTAIVTSTFLKTAVPLAGTGVVIKENCPLKSDHTHFLPPTTLTPGDDISITFDSTDATGTIKWIKATIYKY